MLQLLYPLINKKKGLIYYGKQTAGRDILGKLAPKFAELDDDVLFGEVWSREDKLNLRDRSMITISALMAQGLFPQLKSHLELGKKHGITKEEAVEIVTQIAFYSGWAKAWSAFPLINEVYSNENIEEKHGGVFGMGKENTSNEWLEPVSNELYNNL